MTSKSSSTSFFIMGFVDLVSTTNVRVFWNSIRPIAFSFVTG